MRMKRIALPIFSGTLIVLGLIGFLVLALPETRIHVQPSWVITVPALSLLLTGIGFWLKRKWAPIVYAFLWIAQSAAVFFMGLPVLSGSGLVGAALVAAFSVLYWRELE